jgi:hypothetical protein
MRDRWQDSEGRWSDEKWKNDDGPHPVLLFLMWLIVPGLILYIIERVF